MKHKLYFTLFFIVIFTASAFSMGRLAPINRDGYQHHGSSPSGGGGLPEPATILLILGGAAGAGFVMKKKMKK